MRGNPKVSSDSSVNQMGEQPEPSLSGPRNALTGEVGTRIRGEQKTKDGPQGAHPEVEPKNRAGKSRVGKSWGQVGSKTRANWPRF
jgi:hypothetical protein